MRYYIVKMQSEYEVIVAAENIAEANHGHIMVIECASSGANVRIISVGSYDGNTMLREIVNGKSL